MSALVSTFIDGLLALFYARKHREDEAKWTDIGLNAIRSFRKWVKKSDWNFANKLYLLEAEFYFLRNDDERAMVCYQASIRAAREHRFVHEEGLAEDKAGTYYLHKGEHDQAMRHFLNAKRCYNVWGAGILVQRMTRPLRFCYQCARTLTIRCNSVPSSFNCKRLFCYRCSTAISIHKAGLKLD